MHDLRQRGQNYGYRSGLNQSMVEHLNTIVSTVESTVVLQPDYQGVWVF